MPLSYSQSNEALIRSIGMVGKSDVMADLARAVLQARTDRDQRILIVGEKDTGKGIIAESLLETRQRDPYDRKRYFVDASCYANDIIGLVENFFGDDRENQPFPALKGGFADPSSLHPTIMYVSNIESFCLPAQNVLACGLEMDRLQNVQVIATACPLLFDRVKKDEFLGDLFSSFERVIVVPPLRERSEDIDCLVPFFLSREFKNGGIGIVKAWDQSATEELKKYDWPGNGLQLSAVIFQALRAAQEGEVVDRKSIRAIFSQRKRIDADSFYRHGPFPRSIPRSRVSVLSSLFARLF